MRPKRHRISSDFVLALSSLLIAFVIWLIAAEADIETDNLTVPVEVMNAPSNYKVEIAPKETIIAVQYPKAQKNSIIAPNFKVLIDVSNIPEFDRREQDISTAWLLNPVDVEKSNVSERVKVIEVVQPKRVSIRAKMYIEWAEIEPVLEGTLKEGYRLAETPRSRPSKIKVTGPLSSLDLLKEKNNGTIILRTEPVDITGESGPFFRMAKVLLPQEIELVNPEDLLAEVIVGVSEIEKTKAISDVPIEIRTFSKTLKVSYDPKVASIEIKAPLSIIQQLSEKDFYCEPIHPVEETGFEGKVAIEAKFEESVPIQVREKVLIQSVRPEAINLTITAETETE